MFRNIRILNKNLFTETYEHTSYGRSLKSTFRQKRNIQCNIKKNKKFFSHHSTFKEELLIFSSLFCTGTNEYGCKTIQRDLQHINQTIKPIDFIYQTVVFKYNSTPLYFSTSTIFLYNFICD